MKKLLALLAACATTLCAEYTPFAILELDSIAKTQAQLTNLGGSVGQPAFALAPLALAPIFGSRGFLGIDRDRPIRIIFSLEDGNLPDEPQPVFVLPLAETAGDNYLKSLATMATQKDSSGPLSTWEDNDDGFTRRICVAGGNAIFADESNASDEFLLRIAAELTNNPNAYSVPGLPNTAARMQLLLPPFHPALRTATENLIEDFETTHASIDRTQLTEAIKPFFELLREVSSYSLGLDYAETYGFSVHTRIEFQPNSSLLKIIPTQHALSLDQLGLAGENPELLAYDALQIAFVKKLFPLLNPLLKIFQKLADEEASSENTEDIEKIHFFAKLITEDLTALLEASPNANFGFLTYDNAGRPFIPTLYAGCANPQAFLDSLIKFQNSLPEESRSTYQTRTAQGLVIYSAPLKDNARLSSLDLPVALLSLITAAKPSNEMTVQNNNIYACTGPEGTLEYFLANPPQQAAACKPTLLFNDVLGKYPTYSLTTIDLFSIAHKILSFYNKYAEEDDQLPPELIALLSADPGRLGLVAYAPDPTSLSSTIRFTPGLIRQATTLIQVLNALDDDDEDDEDEEDEELSDDELNQLLEEAGV